MEFLVRRDVRRGMKQVIRGVLRRKIAKFPLDIFSRFQIGDFTVYVPTRVFKLFEEGQAVCIERTCGTWQFLSIRLLDDKSSD